jgi:hypothetical protein
MAHLVPRTLVGLTAACLAVLLKVSVVHAEAVVPSAYFEGKWVLADIPGSNELFTVRVEQTADRTVLTLPEKEVRLASGQDVVLQTCGTAAYCSTKDFSPTVRFELLARNKAEVLIKGSDGQGWIYVDASLRREAD